MGVDDRLPQRSIIVVGYVIGARGPFPETLVGTIEGVFTPRLSIVEAKEPDYMISISLGEGNWEPP